MPAVLRRVGGHPIAWQKDKRFRFRSFASLLARKDRLHFNSAGLHRWEVVSVVFRAGFFTLFPLSRSFQGISLTLANIKRSVDV